MSGSRRSSKRRSRLIKPYTRPSSDTPASVAGQEGAQRYRFLVPATTFVVWSTDASGAFVEPQPLWEAYTGQPWEEHRGWGWTAMLHPDDREAITQQWERALAMQTVYE